MLLWQRKNMPRLAFSFRLGFLVLFMHCIAILFLFKQSISVHEELHVSSAHNYIIGADIVVVPFKKIIAEQPVSASKPLAQESQRNATELKDLQRPANKKSVPATKKVEAKKTVTEKPVTPDPVVPEAAPVKEKIEPERPPVENRSVEKPKPAVEQSSLEKPKAEEKKAVPVQQPAKQYIGTRQLRMMQIQQAIVEQLQIHWHPPEGFEPDAEVILSVHIGTGGEVADIEMKQSSGICVYDVHARSAVYEMQFPKACWGNTVTISFN